MTNSQAYLVRSVKHIIKHRSKFMSIRVYTACGNVRPYLWVHFSTEVSA